MIPSPVISSIRAGWSFPNEGDPLDVVGVACLTAGEFLTLAMTPGASIGLDDLAEALESLPSDAAVYDVTDDVSRAVYTADGTQIWALS